MMIKTAFLSAAVAALIGLATAQTSKPQSAKINTPTSKQGSQSAKSSIKTLTPKSAMPPAHKTSVSAPRASTANRNTKAELSRLERQNTKLGAPKSSNTGAAKVPPVKSDAKPSVNGS